ncbi:hypothetical protein DXG03_009448 [Asterophora parasitica]|uniref:Glycosyltransferase family 1 protein n=1 Tax=Asterophora parasitica TaxID=117018 RepID=A0A9P7GCU2_9AGAR|nr:hypothetical protein DXG03_009448 [Asterophora parasitica]
MAVLGDFAISYASAYETLVQAKPITCATTGTVFEAVIAPTAIILDPFGVPQLHATRALTGHSVPIISWLTGGASTLIRNFGPESIGGTGSFGAKVEAEAARTGKPALQVGEELYRHTDGTLVEVPGLPAIDAQLLITSDAYEKESLDAVRAWFSDSQKPVYAVGPLLPAASASTRSDLDESGTNVATFLDNALQKYGQRSVLFISFGTNFWPAKNLEEVIGVLIEKEFPFILAHGSPFAKLSEELTQKVKSSSLGLLTPWAPQQFLLNHPATGWFLTHGGHGGITESLANGIPLIAWPFEADQPAAAAHLSENLKVAFELLEVRTGLGLQRLHRNGKTPKGTPEAVVEEIRAVVDAARGEEGEKLRKNAEKLKEAFVAAWEDGGAAKVELHHFLEKYA